MTNELFQQFREKLDKEKTHFGGPDGAGGARVLGTVHGPASFRLVEILFEIAEAQAKEIEELKRWREEHGDVARAGP